MNERPNSSGTDPDPPPTDRARSIDRKGEPGTETQRPAPPLDGNAIADLYAGMSDEEVARRRGLPLAAVAGVRSFYDLMDSTPRVCDGTACHFAGSPALRARLGRTGAVGAVRCLGHCYAAPSFQSGHQVFAKPDHEEVEAWVDEWGETGEPHEDSSPVPRMALVPNPIVLRNLVRGAPPPSLEEFDLPEGDAILEALEVAGLRGRGGAAFLTAAKWRSARDAGSDERFVVANGDEGDPGSFVDRLLLEEDPFSVLAGMVACARVIGARRGIVYIRGEYPRAQAVVRRAIQTVRDAGLLGAAFDVEVVSGAGSYICGEETALLASIEGRRAEPRPKPPYPSEFGLYGRPTVVQNVETLAVVPWVVRARRRSGTKAMSLSGAVARPGVVEIALGTPLRRVLEQAGGKAPAGRRWKMALVGGPIGRVLPESLFDTPLDFSTLPGLGHAGVVVLDQTVSAGALARHLFGFALAESCGTCAPCRIGASLLGEMPGREALERLLATMEEGSLCGFGQGVPRPIRDLILHYGDEVFA